MLTITRSIYGAQIQSYLNLGRVHAPATTNTTMNELFNIHNQATIDAVNDPQTALSYFCIGNGGHRFETNGDGVTKSAPIPHSAADAGLYSYLPFIMRPVNNDLTDNERKKYGMRVPKTVGGVTYWAYYLKLITTSSITADLKRIVVEDGVKTISPFVPDNSNLTPQVPVIPSNGAITTDGTFLAVTSTLDLSLSVNDAVELANVAQILYNDPDYAIISEIGLVSAIVSKNRQLLNAQGQPTANVYTEALQATITSYTSTYHQLSYGNQGLDLFLDLGATEPLFGPTVTTVQGG